MLEAGLLTAPRGERRSSGNNPKKSTESGLRKIAQIGHRLGLACECVLDDGRAGEPPPNQGLYFGPIP
jgi:hypothetical protein